MFTAGLSKATQTNLESLTKTNFVKEYYLAGGTALSLHLGHRFSNDLDFFSQTPAKPETIINELNPLGNLEVFQNDEGTFNGVLNKVKLSFFVYPYPLLFPRQCFNKIAVADPLDIACMKIDAISTRGKKRDFIDLYLICKKMKPLRELLVLFAKKYKSVKFNDIHILKSLVYFADADSEDGPEMIEKVDWQEIKNFFISQMQAN